MFARVNALSAFVLALPVLAAASVLPQDDQPDVHGSDCFNQTLLCCGAYMANTKQGCTSLPRSKY